MLIVDGHLDLAMNALAGNRDLSVSAYTIRTHEFGSAGKGKAQGTVALPEMRQGRVALSFVTVVARSSGQVVPHIDFASPVQAYAVAQGQLAYYRALERWGHARVITGRAGLEQHLAEWEAWDAAAADGASDTPPLGFIVLMECADPILRPAQLEAWWSSGLRMIGPAHFGPGRYAGGTGSELGLNELGRELLREMERLELMLDLTHLSDEAFWEALDHFGGPVLASHSNSRVLVPNQRQFTDEQFLAIAERDGVVGLLIGCSDLVPGWVVGARHNGHVTLHHLVDHIDYICQLTGSARHVAIGSDLDGGVGRDEFPRDIDTIADLQRLPALLEQR
ncbi:MAG: membrane dipeptidase, partial [Gemmatimonadota bacterium]